MENTNSVILENCNKLAILASLIQASVLYADRKFCAEEMEGLASFITDIRNSLKDLM